MEGKERVGGRKGKDCYNRKKKYKKKKLVCLQRVELMEG